MVTPLLRPWLPPAAYAIADRLRRGRTGLGAPLPNWAAAVAAGTGYDDRLILERVDAQAPRSAAAGQERDGVTLVGPAVPFPLVACLLRTAAARAADGFTVIDFGGSLGSSYHQCKAMLVPVAPLHWRIVEQPHYVARGKAAHQTASLTFHDTMEEAALAGAPDVILFSGVLQYLDDPAAITARAVALAPRAIVIDRTPMSALAAETITIQYVPADIFKARLPFRIFAAGQIDRALTGYRCVATFDTVDPDMRSGPVVVKFRGALYEREATTYGLRKNSHGLRKD